MLKQISVALSFDEIEAATVILYAPQMKNPKLRRLYFHYSKQDLADNIEIIKSIVKEYNQAVKDWKNMQSVLEQQAYNLTELDIQEDITKKIQPKV